MGSAKFATIHPQLPLADQSRNKSIKYFLKKPFKALFGKDKRKDKQKIPNDDIDDNIINTKPTNLPPPTITPITTLLANFEKLKIEKEKSEQQETEFDEFKNFSIKLIKTDGKENNNKKHTLSEAVKTKLYTNPWKIQYAATNNNRTCSETSVDSGCSVSTDIENDFNKLTLEQSTNDKSENKLSREKSDEKNKIEEKDDQLESRQSKKRLKTIFISRGPIRSRNGLHTNLVHAYAPANSTDCYNYKQINQVNRQSLTGGRVLINNIAKDNSSDIIDKALFEVDLCVKNFASNSFQEQVDCWQIAQEFITEEERNKLNTETEKLLTEILTPKFDYSINDHTSYYEDPDENAFKTITNCYMHSSQSPVLYENEKDIKLNTKHIYSAQYHLGASPYSEQSYCNKTLSDYTLSPERLTPNSDFENYQEIVPFEDQVSNFDIKLKQESPLTLSIKHFKDVQKNLVGEFCSKYCCNQAAKGPRNKIFKENINKLEMRDRKILVLQVARLDLKTLYGVLHRILLSLSKNNHEEDRQKALFCLICERILMENGQTYLQDFGLSLLKSAALRCPHRPELTRYLVACISSATASTNHLAEGKRIIFDEVDSLGDNLVIACARGGDRFADVLAEIVDVDISPPLFDVHHANLEGYRALHVACALHTGTAPRTHIIHVLLQHAQCEIDAPDFKAGETALHLATSCSCDVQLVMTLFAHAKRKFWRSLAHRTNRSLISPLDYAKIAINSKPDCDGPKDVYNFLKRCR